MFSLMQCFALVIHLVNLISLISAKNPEKCYSNQTFYTGITEYCPQEIPHCCYDLIGTYYCCEQNQLISVLKNGSIIFGTILLWVIIITSFFCFCIQIQSIDGQIETKDDTMKGKQMTLELKENKNKDKKSLEKSIRNKFSEKVMPTKPKDKEISKNLDEKIPVINKETNELIISKTQTPESQKKTIIGPAIGKTETQSKVKTEMSEKLEKITDYRPAWGQFDSNKQMSQKSDQRIQFKEKTTKSLQTPQTIEAALIASPPQKSKSSPRSSSPKESPNSSSPKSSAQTKTPDFAIKEQEEQKKVSSPENLAVEDKPLLITEEEQMAEKKPEESSSMQKRVKDMQKLLNPSKFN